jgi:RNA polymerase sigma factor (sigma-70 family)
VSTGPAQERSAPQCSGPPDRSSTEHTADLLLRVRAGEAAAWNLLVERMSGLLWSVARSHRLSADECADVVQNTWLRLLENLDAVREPERLPGWLATTARRECLRSLRTAKRVSPLDQEGADERPDDTLEPLDASLLRDERDAQLWQAFAQLPPGCQALLRLLLADPAPSYEDVAAALDRPVGAIGPTRGRCLKRLRAVLERVPADSAVHGGAGEARS